MIAVRTDGCFGEADGFIAARPVEGGLENDFFGRFALRFVEAAGGFELAKDVGDAVIADAIAGSEVGVRVVVEGAPAYAACVLRVGGDLVVDAGVAQRVLALALVVVSGFSG